MFRDAEQYRPSHILYLGLIQVATTGPTAAVMAMQKTKNGRKRSVFGMSHARAGKRVVETRANFYLSESHRCDFCDSIVEGIGQAAFCECLHILEMR
jgi:hypothetical protein